MQPVLSSIVTACGPARLHVHLDAAQAGQQVGDLAVDEMAAVELGGDLHRQPQRRHAASIRPVSGTARTKLPPRPMKALTSPSSTPSQASTVFRPFSRGGSKP